MMEAARFKALVFDDDILKVIEAISFTAQKYTKCKEITEELETKDFDLRNVIKDMKNSQENQLEANASLKKLIAEQQSTISKLVAIKNNVKTHSEEILKRDDNIKTLEEEIVQLTFKHTKEKLTEQDCQNLTEGNIKTQYKHRIQKLKDEKNAAISKTAYRAQELKEELLRFKAKKEEQKNALVLDYEEILQRAYAHRVKIQDEMKDFTKSSDANISIYLKRIEELEQTKDQRKNIEAAYNLQSGSSSFNLSFNRMSRSDLKSSCMNQVTSNARALNINPSSHMGLYKLASKKV